MDEAVLLAQFVADVQFQDGGAVAERHQAGAQVHAEGLGGQYLLGVGQVWAVCVHRGLASAGEG
ncbi:hypothetical protein JCM18897A_52950 [Streptomyces sp. JCM 18897]|nr:hypothetical protein MTP02_07010 [Streptomyces albus]